MKPFFLQPVNSSTDRAIDQQVLETTRSIYGLNRFVLYVKFIYRSNLFIIGQVYLFMPQIDLLNGQEDLLMGQIDLLIGQIDWFMG